MEKKKVLTAVAVGAATVAAGVGASQVHADSVTVTKQQVGDETKVTTTTVKDNASQAKIAKDKQAVSNQQNVVDKAKASMDSAQSKVDQDSANTAAAQTKVDNAKSKLDSAKAKTDTTQIQSKINSDQQQISDAQNQISNVKDNISTDQDNITRDKQAISDANQNAKDDQAKLTQDQNSLNSANGQLISDKSQVTNIQSQISGLQNELNNVPPVIKLSNTYISDLKNGKVDPQGVTVPTFTPNKADDYNIVPDALTSAQEKELNVWASEIINGLRKQTGVGAFTPNQNMIDMANEIVKGYEKDNWDIANASQYIKEGKSQFGHDDAVISKAEADHGIESDQGNIVEDASGYYQATTMNDLKQDVLNAIVQLITGDSMHAENLLLDNPNGGYMAVAFDKGIDPYGSQFHLETVGSNFVTNAADFTGKDLEVPDTTAIQQQVQSLQNKLSTANQAAQNDQQTVNNLTNQVNADKAKIAQDTPSNLTNQLNKDQQQLANDQAKLTSLQKGLADAQNQLTQDQNALEDANSPAAQAALAQAQQDYANAVKALNDAQSQENTDREALAQFQQDYAGALAKLNELETILKNDEGETTTVSVQWIKNQHPATTSAISNRYVLGNNIRRNNTSRVSTSKFNGMDEVQAAEVPGLRRSNRNNGLPDTGDRQNNAASIAGLLGLGLAGILSMFGLADRKKQH